MSASGTIVLTGANGGLGSAIAGRLSKETAYANYHKVYTVRDPQTADALKVATVSAPASSYDSVALDLSSLEGVRKAAANINGRIEKREIPHISALILNAAYQDGGTQKITDDGFDLGWQATYLSQWLFSLLLLKNMAKDARILVIGSWSHKHVTAVPSSKVRELTLCSADDNRNKMGGPNVFAGQWHEMFTETEKLAKGTWNKGTSFLNGFRRYGTSKLCQIMSTYELQRRLNEDPRLNGISVVCVDPGAMSTGLTRYGGFVLKLVMVMIPLMAKFTSSNDYRTPERSAGDVLEVCLSAKERSAHETMMYYDGDKLSETGVQARDGAKQRKLWHDSVEYARLQNGETALQDWK